MGITRQNYTSENDGATLQNMRHFELIHSRSRCFAFVTPHSLVVLLLLSSAVGGPGVQTGF
eukprot:2715144-Amphidinium_carterae.1